MPVALEAVKHKRDEDMLTGIRKAKCPCCGHEFIAMEGGFVPNQPARCPKCGSVAIRTESSSTIKMLLDAVSEKGKRTFNSTVYDNSKYKTGTHLRH